MYSKFQLSYSIKWLSYEHSNMPHLLVNILYFCKLDIGHCIFWCNCSNCPQIKIEPKLKWGKFVLERVSSVNIVRNFTTWEIDVLYIMCLTNAEYSLSLKTFSNVYQGYSTIKSLKCIMHNVNYAYFSVKLIII